MEVIFGKNIILVPHTYRKSIHIELQDANLMLLFDGFKNKNKMKILIFLATHFI